MDLTDHVSWLEDRENKVLILSDVLGTRRETNGRQHDRLGQRIVRIPAELVRNHCKRASLILIDLRMFRAWFLIAALDNHPLTCSVRTRYVDIDLVDGAVARGLNVDVVNYDGARVESLPHEGGQHFVLATWLHDLFRHKPVVELLYPLRHLSPGYSRRQLGFGSAGPGWPRRRAPPFAKGIRRLVSALTLPTNGKHAPSWGGVGAHPRRSARSCACNRPARGFEQTWAVYDAPVVITIRNLA
jgi:hypothetical protein